MKLKKLPHPIPYQGSKRNLAPDILRYFPEQIDVLYEPFAGSAYHHEPEHRSRADFLRLLRDNSKSIVLK